MARSFQRLRWLSPVYFGKQGKILLEELRKKGLIEADSPEEDAEDDAFWAAEAAKFNAAFKAATEKTASEMKEALRDAAASSLMLGAERAAGGLNLGLRFDLDNPRAVEYMDEHGAALVASIDETTRDYLRTVVTNGVDEGWSYNKIANAITERYLDFAVGKPQLHIASRAHGIAVTEAGMAYERGNRLVADDVAESGLEMEKFWLTVEDERVEPECAGNQMQGWIALKRAFSSGHQEPLAHPYCRCTALYRRIKDAVRVKPSPAQPKPGSQMYNPNVEDIETAQDSVEGAVKLRAAIEGVSEEEVSRRASANFRTAVEGGDLAIRADPDSLLGILESGRFKNQFETGTSGGSFDVEARARAELHGLGISLEAPASDRPIYGYVTGTGSSGFEATYGQMEVILKDNVRERATVTAGDSLHNFHGGLQVGTSLTAPQLEGMDGAFGDLAKNDISEIRYFEVQIRGGVSMADIDRVVFHEAFDSWDEIQDVRDALAAAGISISRGAVLTSPSPEDF